MFRMNLSWHIYVQTEIDGLIYDKFVRLWRDIRDTSQCRLNGYTILFILLRLSTRIAGDCFRAVIWLGLLCKKSLYLSGSGCFATDGQSARLSRCRAPRPDFYYCRTFAVFMMWGALPDERTGLQCIRTIRCHSPVQVPQNSCPHLTVSFEPPPTWRARFPYLYPPGTLRPSYTPGHWVSLYP
jgi:hypothetical protein